MKEPKLVPESPEVVKSGPAGKGAIDKLRRYITPEETEEQREKTKNEGWREQE